MEQSKEVSVQFASAYHTYDSDNPDSYIENSKPLVTNAIYEKMVRTQRRETLERSYTKVLETNVTPVVNTSSKVVRWNVIVTGEARSVDDSISPTEDWYLVSLRYENDEWKG